MDPNLSITKSVPTSLGATRSNQHSRQDHLGDMKSERTHARTQVSESNTPAYYMPEQALGLGLGLVVEGRVSEFRIIV